MTRLQIIQEALNRANRPDLLQEGRLWLSLFLESQYRNQDWPFAMKTVQLPVIEGSSLPADYLRARDGSLLYGTQKIPVFFLTPEQYDAATRAGASPSVPNRVYVDENARTFNWVPVPAQIYTLSLRYYYMPAMPDPYTTIGDSEIPLWQTDVEILIQAVYVRALQYDDDARYDKEEEKLYGREGMIARAKMNNADFRAGSSRIKLGKSFRRRL